MHSNIVNPLQILLDDEIQLTTAADLLFFFCVDIYE